MGRGKVVLKRIEDRSSRHVSFSKRRGGLMKKAHELTVLCDVDLALFVFSGKGRLYEFSSGESVTHVIDRYQSYRDAEEMLYNRSIHDSIGSGHGNRLTADDLVHMIRSDLEAKKLELLDIAELNQLEQQLDDLVRQIKTKKMQLEMEAIKDLKTKEKLLREENKMMEKEITASQQQRMMMNNTEVDPNPPLLELNLGV